MDHLEGAPALRKFPLVLLLVHQPGGSRHPLHISRMNGPAIPAGVAMLDASLVGDRHGFKAAMWMPAYAARLISGGKAGSAELYFNSAALVPVINKPQSYKITLRYSLLMGGTHAWAQNLGATPQTNVAVQGETGAQPEGAFLNMINWVANVIAPIGAVGAG